jgi:hypothetical protein
MALLNFSYLDISEEDALGLNYFIKYLFTYKIGTLKKETSRDME